MFLNVKNISKRIEIIRFFCPYFCMSSTKMHIPRHIKLLDENSQAKNINLYLNKGKFFRNSSFAVTPPCVSDDIVTLSSYTAYTYTHLRWGKVSQQEITNHQRMLQLTQLWKQNNASICDAYVHKKIVIHTTLSNS